MRSFLLFIYFVLNASSAIANCNFVTANFAKDLQSPENIESIHVNVPKAGKFNKNFVKIMVSRTRNIPPKLKKKFYAKIIVNYIFGRCFYEADIKQSGDWKDHIKLTKAGHMLRSLNVKLHSGNLMNAVKFKLLIPETRNNLNEVLGTLIMRDLGFISPETFQVNTKVNGVNAIMLFQEDARKEMLERNSRREGPLFEGDESLIWSFKNTAPGELQRLALARLTNINWFHNALASQKISLRSYTALQRAYMENRVYLDTSANRSGKYFIIRPNGVFDQTFETYSFALFAMNGLHAMYPNNRRYYYNSFNQEFEPVYYDGDLNLTADVNVDLKSFPLHFTENIDVEFLRKIQNIGKNQKLFIDFHKRTALSKVDDRKFFNSAIRKITTNALFLSSKLYGFKAIISQPMPFEKLLDGYISAAQTLGIDQVLISDLLATEKGSYSFHVDERLVVLTPTDVAKIISNHRFNDQRHLIIKEKFGYPVKEFKNLNKLYDFKNGEIYHSSGIRIEIQRSKKILTIYQTNSNDWILIKDAEIAGWKLNFIGVLNEQTSPNSDIPKLNSQGLTGCVNFFNVRFFATTLNLENGGCEDSLNIVSSSGNIDEIYVINSAADAVDIDFSNLDIVNSVVEGAGNDCFDVSWGSYRLKRLEVSDCLDKGLSVGENSQFNLNFFSANMVSTGVSSKDFSHVIITKASISNVQTCYEALQKKMEFGGANITINALDCVGTNRVDQNSRAQVTTNEF